MNDVYIFDTLRTPRGKGKPDQGGLSGVHPQELLAGLLTEIPRRLNLDPAALSEIEDVIVGCVSQVNEQGACIARNAVLSAGWPLEVTGSTINRFCASGLSAVNMAARGIGSGFQSVMVAGGVESMSRVPMFSDGGGLDGKNEKLGREVAMVPQGISADLIATLEGFTRETLDNFAALSQARADVAVSEGRFDKSIIPVKDADGNIILAKDEHPRPGTTAEKLATMEPAFAKLGAKKLGPAGETADELALRKYPEAGKINHVHHAGNSSGIVDGAALVLMGDQEFGQRHGLRPRARIRSMATIGAEPVIMLTAPAPASRRALEKSGMKPGDIDLWEINEAFAAVPLQTIRVLDIDPERVNVNGGSIALGHPLGATGAILLGTALDELERSDRSTALITLCVGGGMGVATIIERV